MRTPIKQVKNPNVIMENYKEKKAIKHRNDIVEPMLPKSFVSYPVMIAIMAVLQIVTILYGIKMFVFLGLTVSVGWLITLPCVFYIFQISAECYGWQYARQMIWINFLVNGIFTVLLFAFKLFPFTGVDKPDVQIGYIYLLDNNILYFAPTMWIGMLFADFATSSLMCWSRFQCNGKFLAIRVVVLHCLAEIIILSGGFIAGSLSGESFSTIWHFSVDSFLARSIVMLALLPVAKLVIWYIQHKVEHVIVFDLKSTFNIFNFNINPNDSVMFSVGGSNDNNQVGNIDMKKLAQAYSNLIIEEQQQKRVNNLKTANSVDIHNHHNSNVVS